MHCTGHIHGYMDVKHKFMLEKELYTVTIVVNARSEYFNNTYVLTPSHEYPLNNNHTKLRA